MNPSADNAIFQAFFFLLFGFNLFFFAVVTDWASLRYLFTVALCKRFNEIQCVHNKWISKQKHKNFTDGVAAKRRYYDDSMSLSLFFLSRHLSSIFVEWSFFFFFRSPFLSKLAIQQSQNHRPFYIMTSKGKWKQSFLTRKKRGRCRNNKIRSNLRDKQWKENLMNSNENEIKP